MHASVSSFISVFSPAHHPLFIHYLISRLVYASKNSFALHPPSGSDSSSSVGSSSGSLSRPTQLPLPAPVLPQPGRGFTVAPTAPLPAAPIGGSASTPASQSATTNCNINTNASFYIVPLDTTAIPPGSVLLNPQTGGYLLTNIQRMEVTLRIRDTNSSC